MKFWQYLKNNHIGILFGVTLIFVSFVVYWLLVYGWDDSKQDIKIGSYVFGVIWIIVIVGDLINYKKL